MPSKKVSSVRNCSSGKTAPAPNLAPPAKTKHTYVDMPCMSRRHCSPVINCPSRLYILVSKYEEECLAKENCLGRPPISCLFSSLLVLVMAVRETTSDPTHVAVARTTGQYPSH